MHECLLCERDMKKSRTTFGNGCINKIFEFLDMEKPKRTKGKEQVLYKNVMKRTGISSLNSKQKIWLTDRYLAYQYLSQLHYGNYEEIRKQLNNDIKNINRIEKVEELITAKKLKLKNAYQLYKRERKFENSLNELKKCANEEENEKIKLMITSFMYIFNLYGNRNQYERSQLKAMQYAFWQTVIEVGGRYAEFVISADFLQHSLEEEPQDLYIKDGKVIEEIKEDKQFKEKIIQIIEKYGAGKNEFLAKGDDVNISFNNKDLYFSIHSANMIVKGNKYNGKWKLEISLDDIYDYSEPKDIKKYYFDTNSIFKSVFSSTLYNLAATSMKLGVMKKYGIYINFKLEETEVKS